MPDTGNKEEKPAEGGAAETGGKGEEKAGGAETGKGKGAGKDVKKGKKGKVPKGKKIRKKKQKKIKGSYYELGGETLKRGKRNCPRCGHGVFMAEHKDRHACGRCSYTDWKRAGKPEGGKQDETAGKVSGEPSKPGG